jgi:hypothetical protein
MSHNGITLTRSNASGAAFMEPMFMSSYFNTRCLEPKVAAVTANITILDHAIAMTMKINEIILIIITLFMRQ